MFERYLRKDKVTDKIYKDYFIPLTLSSVGLAASNIVDSLVVGQRMGDNGLAAIGISSPIYMLYAIFYITLGIGGSIVCAEEVGNGKKKDANRRFQMLMELSVLIGIVFTVMGLLFTPQILFLLGTKPGDGLVYEYTYQYVHALLLCAPAFFLNQPLYLFVRNDDDPKLAGIGYFVGNAIDVCLCFYFVVMLEWGVKGSIYSTLIGQIIACAVYAFHFIKNKKALHLGLAAFDFEMLKRPVQIGLSTSNQYLAQFIFIMLTNRILISKMGDLGVAVFDVVINVSYVVLLFYDAASSSMQPISATFHGERNVKGMNRVLGLALITGISGGLILNTLVCIFAPNVAMVFGLVAPEAVELGTAAIRMYCVSAVFAGFNIIFGQYYQATGRERLTYLAYLLRSFLILILSVLVFSALSNKIFWMFYITTEVLSLIAILVCRKNPRYESKEAMPKEEDIVSLEIYSKDELSELFAGVEAFCEKYDVPIKKSMYINNTVEEVCVSIIENAVKTEGFYIRTTLCKEPDGENYRLCVRDNALEYNPFDMQTQKIDDNNVDDLDVLGGLGIMMVKSKAKDFYYNRLQAFNTMIIIV